MGFSLFDFILTRAKKLNITYDDYDDERSFTELVLWEIVNIAKAYRKENTRKISVDRFLVTFFRVHGGVYPKT